ncbi:hypothetical protein GH714_033113 [Hevea brasiliensis]|uniref:Transcriptional coactivator Hfi1/Transcriptional adapter 1 n=1 Tax=Hevea brasiliensis TaxID=3981 RepID=A0A6A6L298_HEVBR|nr:hypothetical protein GH714_033113 [Hevea brasiliensis]
MPAAHHFTRIDTAELKLEIERKLGHPKAQKYFDLLTKFLSLKISKSDFDRLCIGTIGRENVRLHNLLLRSIIKNAQFSKTTLPKESKAEGALGVKVPNGYQKSSLQSLCRDFLQSPRKGSRPPGSVEDGEEVDQAAGSPSIYSRSPVRAPLGVPLNTKGARKVLCNRLASSYRMGTCQSSGELPDSNSLRKRLEQKLEMEGIKVSVDCANLLNNSLDVYLKRLIKPCMDLAGSRSGHKHTGQGQIRFISGLNGVRPVRYFQKPNGSTTVSMLDFRLTMELNPKILGEEWPMQLEKVCFRASEE